MQDCSDAFDIGLQVDSTGMGFIFSLPGFSFALSEIP